MKLCVRDFSMLALKDPLFLAEVVLIGTAQLPWLQVLTLHRHQYCTSSQRVLGVLCHACVSECKIGPPFNHVSASLRPRIWVFITPLPSALAWCIKWNPAGQGLLLSLLCLLLGVCLCSTLPLCLGCSILSLPGAGSCPSHCPDFHFPDFSGVPRRVELAFIQHPIL